MPKNAPPKDNLLGVRLKEDLTAANRRLDEASHEMGLSPAYFSLVTQGKRTPSAERLEQIVDHFDFDIRRYWQWVRPAYLLNKLQNVAERIPPEDGFWAESGLRALRRAQEPRVSFITNIPEREVRAAEHEENFVLVPLVDGDIACGPPEHVERFARGYQPVYHTLVKRNIGPFSCVRATGTSMSPIIEDGSLCIIDHGQRDPERLRGDFVALNDEYCCTIKRLKLSADRRFLIGDPFNPEHDPVTIALDEERDYPPIIGKVIWSDRQY